MKLFFSPTSPYVRKCLATALELGLTDRIELLLGKASPVLPDTAIAEHNPLGKVPTLITDDGQALYDSRVICEYLDHLAGGQLFPQGPARWQALMILGSFVTSAATKRRCGPRRCAGATGAKASSTRCAVRCMPSNPARQRWTSKFTSAR